MEPGSLAAHVPRDADLYFEAVVRPGDDLQERLEAALGTLNERDYDVADDRAELIASAEEQLPLAADAELDYEEDVEPWLGERVGAYAEVTESPELLALGITDLAVSGAVILSVQDSDRAAEALLKLADPEAVDDDPPEGVDVYVAQHSTGTHAIALIDGAMIVGDPEAVAGAVLDPAEERGLERSRWFEDARRLADQDGAFAFLVAPFGDLARIDLARSAPKFAENLGDELLRVLPYDLDGSVVVTATAQDSGLGLDTAYPMRTGGIVREARRRFEMLPADSFLAFADPVFLPSLVEGFALGIEIGLERNPGFDPLAKLGYDPLEALRLLRAPTSVYARRTDTGDMQIGANMGADEPEGFTGPADGVRFVLGTSGATSIHPLGNSVYDFVAKIPGFAGRIEVRQGGDGVWVTATSGGASNRSSPAGKSLGDSGRLRSFDRALGGGFAPLGFAEIGATLDALEDLPVALPAVVPEASQDVADARIWVGGREDDDHLVLRYLLGR